MIAEFTTLQQTIRSGQMNARSAIIDFSAAASEYARESGSQRLMVELSSALMLLGLDYSERDYADAPTAFDARFATITALLVEIDQKIAVVEAEDAEFDNFCANHPDAEFGWFG